MSDVNETCNIKDLHHHQFIIRFCQSDQTGSNQTKRENINIPCLLLLPQNCQHFKQNLVIIIFRKSIYPLSTCHDDIHVILSLSTWYLISGIALLILQWTLSIHHASCLISYPAPPPVLFQKARVGRKGTLPFGTKFNVI